uniref:Uncharacterized protein LOC111100394 isoform X6 n=1 Tax=Crassostrea virginica TaxID=6565 RepID=A0A8B8A8Y1_CRAVI|nr:uncharacterized protein LOC111100394 isoform X6 [Crassostrea virginica]
MSNPKVRVVLILVGIVFLKSNGNHREVMATRTATRVSVCPRNEKEWLKASKRLNCSDISPVNRYHCLPADNLTTLLEFCYNRTRPQVVKGLCMVFIEKINIVNHYDCSKFNEGCPNKSHYSNEMYRFPACFEIDPTQHCYKAEVSCQQFTRFLTDDLNTTLSTLVNDTSYSPTADTDVEIFYPLVIILPVLFLLGLIIIFVAWKMRHRLKKTHNNNEKKQTDERKSLLDTEPFENFEDDISKMGIDCLLQRLPSDQERLLMIAKKLKIPEEILYWSLENREKFVKSMKIGNISVYNGRGMVIGCARAGKSTLVKKLKGEKDLNTTSTSGIEVHSHLFKLHKNESTITVCPDKEKNKACLCITPTTLENIEGNKKEASFSVQDEKILEQSKATNSLQTKQNEDLDGRPSSSKLSSNLNVNEKSDAMHSADTAKQSQQHDNDLTLSVDMFQENEINNAKVDEKVDLSDCKPSVSTNNLKMLSLLDFAGHSAYYACHHIFFSPRAFFILVVDMTKELASVASEACKENDLIYSNWTYADYIRYWLGSIHTYSSKEAPVILVLSHAEDNRDEYINQGVHVTTDNKTVGQREDRESTSLKNSQDETINSSTQPTLVPTVSNDENTHVDSLASVLAGHIKDEYINQGVTTDNKTVGQREDRESTSLKNSQDETINSSTQPTLVPTVSNDENTHVDSLVSVLAGHIKDNVVEARATASGKGTECELKIIPSFSSFDTDSTRDNNITPKSSLDRSKSLQSDLEKRLETFKNYPENAVKDKKELADNGFMYIGDGKNDKVQCVFCRIIFYQWEEADDITSEHRMGSRTCKRVMELDHKNFRGQLDGGMTLIDRILTQNPSSEGRVPVMKDPSLRLESFKYWTFSNKEKPSPEAFSEAGLFYTGKGDHTQCWFCGNLLEEWEPGDVPKEEHDKTFPDCGLVFRDEGSSGQTVML